LEKKGAPLEPKTGRPKSGAMGSFDKAVKEKVEHYRPSQAGWGPLTIQVELLHEAGLEGLRKPSRSTIASYLKEKGKTRPYKKHVPLHTAPCYPPKFPHDLWQMDAEGNRRVDKLGTVCTINLKDSFSKAYVGSLPLVFNKPCNHPQKAHYQTLLRLAFTEFGMNHRLQVDHESVFFDNNSASPFPTELHLWLLGLDIEICYTPKGSPQKQGMVERSHQTMFRQVIAGQTFDSYAQLYERCQQRRKRLNLDIPSRSTNNQPPLLACPSAIRSDRPYCIDKEKEIFDAAKIKKFLSAGKWYRSVSKDKTVSLGGRVYYLPNATPKMELQISFNSEKSEFNFFDADGKLVNSKTAQGISFNELAGNLESYALFLKSHPPNHT
jgi:transposase InsO family protein